MPQEVVFYHSGTPGAPAAALNSAGALAAVLDACLVDGFNSISISSITQSGGIATVTTSGSHNFSVGDRTVDIAGADQADYNGRHEVLSTPASNQFTFAVSPSAVSPATGSMTAKHGAAGWSKQIPATNVRVYTTSSPTSSGHAVQIEDNNPNADSNVTFRSRMVHNWTALNAGDQVAPSALNTKYDAAASASWFVVADGKTVYMGISKHFNVCFGEAASIAPGDVFAFYLSRGRGTGGTAGGTPSHYAGDLMPVAQPGADPMAINTVPAYFLRSYNNAGAEVYCMSVSLQASVMAGSGGASGSETVAMDFVSPAVLEAASVPLFATPCYAVQGTSSADTRVVRGAMRGLYRLAGGLVASSEFTGPASSFVLLPSVQLGSGAARPALLCRTYAGTGTNNEQQFLLDLGPSWDV